MKAVRIQNKLVLLAITVTLAITPHLFANDLDEKLIKASSNGQLNIVNEAIAAGANINGSDNYGNTPLIEAARWGRTQAVVLLLKNGADKKQINSKGATAAKVAADEGYDNIVDIIKKFDAKEVSARSTTAPTTSKATTNHPNSAEFLEAASNGQDGKVKALLAKGVNVDAKDAEGNTALMSASKWGRTETVKILIEAGANRKLTNNKGESALALAEDNGYNQTATILKKMTGRLVADSASSRDEEAAN
jgi:ankyrin repeat protein